MPVIRGHADGLAGLTAGILSNLPDRFALIGLSLGASVAMEMVRQAPERISHLALLDARDTEFTPEDADSRGLDIKRARDVGLESFMEDIMIDRYLHEDNLGRGDLRRLIVDMALDSGIEAWLGQKELLDHRISYRDVLTSFKAPTLVGCGESDRITPPEVHVSLAKARGEKAVVFSGCGHLPVLEDPDAVNEALEGLMAK